MTSFFEAMPSGELVGKILFFVTFGLNCLSLMIGIILSAVHVDPAGPILVGCSLLFFFGIVVGLATSVRDILSTFGLMRKVRADGELVLELGDEEQGVGTGLPHQFNLDELDGVSMEEPKKRPSKND